MNPQDDPLARVAEAIRRYLDERPHAADTVEGIAQWWVPHEGADIPPDWVETTLQRLEAEGVVRPVRAGGRVIWRRAA